jgi:hypothetical protein
VRDLHFRILPKRGIAPVAVGTTGTGQTGKVIDRQGFHGVEFLLGYGSITATNAVFTVTVKEGDVTGTLTSAAEADLLGTESAAGIGATASRVSGVSKLVTKSIGYIGVKRYVQCNVKSTVTAAPPIAVIPVLGNAQLKPTQ